MQQTSWNRLTGCESNVSPAICAHEDGRLYILSITPIGHVMFTSIKNIKNGWDSWEVINHAHESEQLSAASDTPPLLLRAKNHKLYLFCRGSDNNLYMTNRHSGNDWSEWKQLTKDGAVRGHLSVTITDSPWCAHILFSGPNQTVHYRQFNDTWSLSGIQYHWPNLREGEIASNGNDELFVALCKTDDNLKLQRMCYPWSGTWLPILTEQSIETSRPCYSLSNIIYFSDSFHVLYVTKAILDDISGSYVYTLAHLRIRTKFYDDGFFRVVYNYQSNGENYPKPTIANY